MSIYLKNECFSKSLKVLSKIIILVLLFVLPLVTCSLRGQVVQKKDLTEKDYQFWSELHLDKVSPDEKWASYTLNYENDHDTLFVRNLASNKTYAIANGNNSFFTAKGSFACLSKQIFTIIDLKTGKQQIIKDISQYEYSKNKNVLIIKYRNKNGKNGLLIQTLQGKIIKQIQNVDNFNLSPDGKQIVYTTFNNNKFAVMLLNLETINLVKWLMIDEFLTYDKFTWQKDSKSIAFTSKKNEHAANAIFYYVLKEDKLFTLDPATNRNFPDSIFITSNQNFKLTISDDLKKVFFSIKNKENRIIKNTNSNVEIWNGNDKYVYLDEQMNGQFEQVIKVGMWIPSTNFVTALTSTALPMIILTGNQKFALLSNPKDYEPQFEMEGPRDFFLMNLATMEKKLLLKKQSSHYTHLTVSPTGNYIAYFKENNWWIYNISANTHTNITQNLKAKFKAKEQLLEPESVCGNPGWSKDDREILLYDQYDLWAISPDGLVAKRLTHGKESKIKYRIAALPNVRSLKVLYNGLKIPNFDLEKELILRATGDDGKTGYFIYNKNLSLKTIVYRDAFIDELYYSPKQKVYFYREQKFDISPRIIARKNSNSYTTIYQSNPQQKKYYWGKSELLRYQNAGKKDLKGVLIYPANYDPKKKYPMIVYIYAVQSGDLHHYTNPTLYNLGGFNPTTLSSQGYFILFPDIIHEYQNPGIAALDCVTAAVKKVTEKNIINSDRIGLIGHSFGGYETAFIITQTNLFKTAVAGGGITDLTSFYLTLGKSSGKPDMYRFQNEQWIMGKTPFEASLEYQRNSPINHIENITTPLLLWSGKQDEQVDPHQSMEYYLALRRLGKKNIMLIYPNEGHSISDPINQFDLTYRVQDWFAYYLKDNLSVEWIKHGTK